MVMTVFNTALYSWNPPYATTTQKMTKGSITMLISLSVLINSQCIHIPKQYFVHLKYVQFLFDKKIKN